MACGRMAAVVVFATAALLVTSAGPASAQDLPAGPGRDILQTRCTTCHETDIIAGQRLSAAGWGRSVDKMVGWGAAVAPAEREPLVAYLAAHFRPTPVVAHQTASGGEAVYRSACLTCHETDLIDQQRLSPAGWGREVDKMIGWGAQVPDADKAALVSYLVERTTK